jgi:isocitrate/isopropylmalate dehydrogenase
MFFNKTDIYQLIYNLFMTMRALKNKFVRSPTLDTVLMVENTIEVYSGEYNRTELWKNLPKKVMWQTYLVILEYLESINKIAFDKYDKIAYIWNPKLAQKLRMRPEIKL